MVKKVWLCSALIASLFLTAACNFNAVYLNREEDNNEGKALLSKFYVDVANKNYAHIEEMASDSLKQLAGPEGISKMMKFISNKAGNYKGYVIADQNVRRVTGTNSETSYNYKLKVTYDKGTVDEIVGFKKENGTGSKLYSYHANSDLFMQ